VDPGATHLHRQERIVEEASAGIADVVGQAAARSSAPDLGGVLRTAVLRPLPRISPGPRVPYRAAGDLPPVAGNGVVRRGRRHQLFRFPRPFDHEIDAGREDPRRSVPAPDRRAAPGWISGGLALPRHAQRLPAGRCGFTRIIQYLPGSVGPVHRTDPASRPQPGETTHPVSALYAVVAARLPAGTVRGSTGWSTPA